MWFRDKPPPPNLAELIRRNLDRSTADRSTVDGPGVRRPAPPETFRRPIGTTKPLSTVEQSVN